jgi:hypothetical protein
MIVINSSALSQDVCWQDDSVSKKEKVVDFSSCQLHFVVGINIYKSRKFIQF